MTESQTLRRAFLCNGVFSLLSGATFLLAGGALAVAAGLPGGLPLRIVGAGLLPFGAFLLWLSRRETLHARDGRAISLCDLLWVLGTAAVLLGWPELMNATGQGVAIAIAGVVAGFAAWQWAGARRIVAAA
jgi:hypothetical protein